MSRPYEQILTQKRSEVLDELETLRDQSVELASKIAVKESQLRNLDDLLALENGSATTPNPRERMSPAEKKSSSSLTDQAAQALEEAGKPTHYKQLLGLLASKDVYVPGKDPGANLIAHITRDERFTRVGRGLYALSNWPSVRSAPRQKTKRRSTRRKIAR
jgi:hypothetical protein